jgi:hypothetical protein
MDIYRSSYHVLPTWLDEWNILCIQEFYIGPLDIVAMCGPAALLFYGILIHENRRRLYLRMHLVASFLRYRLSGLPRWNRTTANILRRDAAGSTGEEM